MAEGTFATAINCMDGRVQLPVIKFLQERFKAEYVDIISEPGQQQRKQQYQTQPRYYFG